MNRLEATCFSVLLNLLQAWFIMVILGALHHSVHPSFPAIGYYMSLIICGIINTTNIEIKADYR